MKKDQERELGRRALIKYTLAAGAALGVSRGKILDILERTAGKQTALAAAASPTKRSVHIRGGQGGCAWYQLLWPHNDVATARLAGSSWTFNAAQTRTFQATGGNVLTVGPNTPWSAGATLLPPEKQVTALMAGVNEIHNQTPPKVVRALPTGSMFAIASVLQANIPTVVPVITVGSVGFGDAPGAPQPASAPSADDIVGLFNSAASQATGLLHSGNHAELYKAQYETLAQLNRASQLSTQRVAFKSSRAASAFLGTNLSSVLAYRTNTGRNGADDLLYGMSAGSQFDSISNGGGDTGGPRRDQIANFGRALAATAKAFEQGLTASVVLPCLEDDPHGAFSGGALTADSTATLATLKAMLDGFMSDLTTRTDPVTGGKIADNIVITFEGDTPKDPTSSANWPDQVPGQSNWMYILGGGKLKTGWFGGIDRNGGVKGYNPQTGASVATPDTTAQAQAACAAVAYAITNGDKRRVGDFTQLNIDGLIV